jgi:hypothetical protein
MRAVNHDRQGARQRSVFGDGDQRRDLLGKSDPSGATNVEWAQSSCSPDVTAKEEP